MFLSDEGMRFAVAVCTL